MPQFDSRVQQPNQFWLIHIYLFSVYFHSLTSTWHIHTHVLCLMSNSEFANIVLYVGMCMCESKCSRVSQFIFDRKQKFKQQNHNERIMTRMVYSTQLNSIYKILCTVWIICLFFLLHFMLFLMVKSKTGTNDKCRHHSHTMKRKCRVGRLCYFCTTFINRFRNSTGNIAKTRFFSCVCVFIFHICLSRIVLFVTYRLSRILFSLYFSSFEHPFLLVPLSLSFSILAFVRFFSI